jgi:hypothetical protein
MTVLLCCPFCGGEARLFGTRGDHVAMCRDADCMGHHYEQDEQGGWNHGLAKNEAIAAWNRRAPQPSPATALREREHQEEQS